MSESTALAQRFWAKVDIRSESECWCWLASTDQHGRGRLRIRNRLHTASRVAWELTYGPIPDGMSVLHRCDNPPCCNPAHLFLGTQTDNMRDMASKGRRYRKLTDSQKATIRRRFADGTSTKLGMAREYGVSRRLIRLVIDQSIDTPASR